MEKTGWQVRENATMLPSLVNFMKTRLVEGNILPINVSPTLLKLISLLALSLPSLLRGKKPLPQNNQGRSCTSLSWQLLFCTMASQSIKCPSNILCSICKNIVASVPQILNASEVDKPVDSSVSPPSCGSQPVTGPGMHGYKQLPLWGQVRRHGSETASQPEFSLMEATPGKLYGALRTPLW